MVANSLDWKNPMSRNNRTVRLLLVIVLIVLLLGALPAWPYSTGWGYYPSSGLGLLLVVIVVVLLLRRR